MLIKISFISKYEQNAKNSQVFCFSDTFLKSRIVSYKPKTRITESKTQKNYPKQFRGVHFSDFFGNDLLILKKKIKNYASKGNSFQYF